MRINQLAGLLIAMSLGLAAGGCQSSVKGEQDLRRASAELEQKHYAEAMTAADRYLAQNPAGPGSAQATYLRGRSIEQRVKSTDAQVGKDLAEARQLYERALGMRPAPQLAAYIRTSLANVVYWLGDYPTAERHWQDAVNKLDNTGLRSWVLYRIGQAQQRQGRWQQADQTFALLQKQFPGSQPAMASKNLQGVRAFYVQVGAFASVASADKLVATLRSKGLAAIRHAKPERKLHVVLVGPIQDHAAAVRARASLWSLGHKDALIVP